MLVLRTVGILWVATLSGQNAEFFTGRPSGIYCHHTALKGSNVCALYGSFVSCLCVCLHARAHIQGVPGGMCQTSGGCSLC